MRQGDKVFDRWDVKLHNWALWIVGRQSTGCGSAYDGEKLWERPPQPPPPLVGEALDTNDLVLRLQPDQQIAVRAMYVWSGTLRQRAGELGIEPRALNERVDNAIHELDAMDQRRHIKAGIPDRTQIRTWSCAGNMI